MNFLPALALMAVIFLFSAQPAEESSEVSGWFGEEIFTAANGLFRFGWSAERIAALSEGAQRAIRKAAHFTEYAVLGFLLFHGFLSSLPLPQERAPRPASDTPEPARDPSVPPLRRWGLPALAAGAIYAASDELHQCFVPGRTGRIGDVAIDVCGVAAGVGLGLLVLRLMSRRSAAGRAPRQKGIP